MNTDAQTESGTIAFGGGVRQPALFLLATCVPVVAVPVLIYPHLGSLLAFLLVMSATFGVIALLAWGALRWEGLDPADVGLSRPNVVPGVALVFGIYALLNLLGAGYLFLTGEGVALSLREPYDTPVLFAAASVAYFAFNGIAEELAFRAYLQNKLIALLGGGSDRARKAAAIALGVGLFALWHVPQRVLIAGLDSPAAVAQSLVSVVVLGAILGVLYEYTRNVVLVGVLHGTFNFQPFFVVGMPTNDLVLLVGVPALVAAVWGYRRWARRTGRPDFAPQYQSSPSKRVG